MTAGSTPVTATNVGFSVTIIYIYYAPYHRKVPLLVTSLFDHPVSFNEHQTFNLRVMGSSPILGNFNFCSRYNAAQSEVILVSSGRAPFDQVERPLGTRMKVRQGKLYKYTGIQVYMNCACVTFRWKLGKFRRTFSSLNSANSKWRRLVESDVVCGL